MLRVCVCACVCVCVEHTNILGTLRWSGRVISLDIANDDWLAMLLIADTLWLLAWAMLAHGSATLDRRCDLRAHSRRSLT